MDGKRALIEDASPEHESGLSNGTSLHNYTSRLPTPDASRSSDASSIHDRRGPTVSDLLSFRPYTTIGVKRDMVEQAGGQEAAAPRSPPYPSHDEKRPLLPPLKMVIANAMNSPPETPRTDGAPFQPSPREPAVSATMFKPLAFYPNKKARTEERPRQWHNDKSRSSNRAPLLEHISSSYPSYTRRLSEPFAKRQRRYSMHTNFTGARCCDSSDKKPYYTFTGRPDSSDIHTASTTRYETTRDRPAFERLPISPSSDTSYGRPEATSHRAPPVQHISDTRPSHYTLLPVPSPEYEQASTSYRQHVAAPEAFRRPSYEQPRAFPREDMNHASCRDSCHANQAAFFMPPHYDYTQGKSRKRSNLPKQSTEVMKTWFDNNISNPYPSEEQKATFSSLTGISMTQVSNWFINHRRRCPELREKRERGRNGGIME